MRRQIMINSLPGRGATHTAWISTQGGVSDPRRQHIFPPTPTSRALLMRNPKIYSFLIRGWRCRNVQRPITIL